MVTCALCGLRFEPGGASCRTSGCPLTVSGCRLAHCPRCGYAAPDVARGLAGRLRRWLERGTGCESGPRRLSDAAAGDGVVDRVEAAPALAAQLTLLGITSGARLTLRQRFPAYVVAVEGNEMALEHAVAETVWIHPEGPPVSERRS